MTENKSSIVPIFNPETGKFKTKVNCVDIEISQLEGLRSKEYLPRLDFDVPWYTLERMFINFTVRTTTFRQMGPYLGKIANERSQ